MSPTASPTVYQTIPTTYSSTVPPTNDIVPSTISPTVGCQVGWMSVILTLGQVVCRNALHWVLPCYAYLILPQMIGLLIKWNILHPHGLVTLIYLIIIETMSGYPDVALHILITKVTGLTMIAFI